MSAAALIQPDKRPILNVSQLNGGHGAAADPISKWAAHSHRGEDLGAKIPRLHFTSAARIRPVFNSTPLSERDAQA